MDQQQHLLLHLYRRAGFGLHPNEWPSVALASPARALDQLFAAAANPAPLAEPSAFETLTPAAVRALSEERMRELRQADRQLVGQQNIAWIRRMADPAEPALLERMTLFWHGHFACTIRSARPAASYLNSLRRYALGNFRDLLLAVAREPAMIRFLNNQQNRKEQPNENFARELMELFTIGRGHYTEADVRAAARAFTGWSSNHEAAYVFRARHHDYGTKEFMGRRGNFNGEDIIDILLEQRQTADFIATKLYRYFVNEQVDTEEVRQLSHALYESHYDLGKTMRLLFSSDWFYAPRHRGQRIKSPAELLAGLLRQLQLRFTDDRALLFVQRALGQVLFDPPNVAGWPGGRRWIDNATLLTRLNLASYIFRMSEFDFRAKADLDAAGGDRPARRLRAELDWQLLNAHFGSSDARACYEQLQPFLLAVPAPLSYEQLRTRLPALRTESPLPVLTLALLSLPEYQLT